MDARVESYIRELVPIVRAHARSRRRQHVTVDVPSRFAFDVSTHLSECHFDGVVHAVGGEHFRCASGTHIRVLCGATPHWPPLANATHYHYDWASQRLLARHV